MLTFVPSLLIVLALHAQSTPPEPRRVTPGASAAEKPVYRALKRGEDRVEGLLQRVECPPGRAVTLVVKLKDGVAKYQAPRLDAVEYIAYTADCKGPMSCGGRAPADRVLVTWRTDGAASRAVAIDFLPPSESGK